MIGSREQLSLVGTVLAKLASKMSLVHAHRTITNSCAHECSNENVKFVFYILSNEKRANRHRFLEKKFNRQPRIKQRKTKNTKRQKGICASERVKKKISRVVEVAAHHVHRTQMHTLHFHDDNGH